MLNRILDWSLRQRVVALALVALMGVGGISALTRLPINSLPDVTPVQVLVITKAGRYSPLEVEQLVSFPIETALNGLPGISEVRSISHFGLSAVTAEFEEDTDIHFARQIVSERVQSVAGDLPQGVAIPQLGPISTALGEIYQYVVVGEGYSLTELRTIQDWLVAPQLKTVPGVTEINSFGGFVRQYDVVVDAEALRTYGVGLNRVIEAIGENNSISGGNFLEHNREQYIVRGFGQIRGEEDLRRIVLANLDDRPLQLRDVARVELGRQLRQGGVTQDGNGEVVTGIVMMLRGGNGREVIRDVEARIDEANRSLPAGVRIVKFYDQADLVERTTETVTTNLLEGGFLVIAVLLLLLGEVRGALIVASVIPFSMLFAFIGMQEFGLAANLMSLGAIDFGMVVDGSVVMVENMVHRLQKAGAERPRLAVMREAAHEVARPIFFGVLIILMVYVPIVTFGGMEGILYRPMAITVATAVFGSLILAFVYVPAIAALTFRRGVRLRRNFVMDWLRPRYQRFLERFLDRRLPILGSALAVFGVSMAVIPLMGTEFLPELDEGSILVEQVRMPSVTLEESMENANWFAGELLRNIEEIETVVPKTGRSDLANDWMGVHQTDVWVILKPRETWREGLTKEHIIEEIRPFLLTEPGLSYNFTQPIAMRVDELTSGVRSDVAVKVFGENLEELNRIGRDIVALLPDLPGTENFFVDRNTGQPYLNVEIDREAIASFGLNVSDVQQVVEAGIGGRAVGQVFEGQRRFDIVVRYAEEVRNTFQDIMNTPVELPDGGWIPLSRVAVVNAQEGPREIARENGWRRIIVGINLADIDIGTYVANLRQAIDERIEVPAGNFLQYAGAFEDQQRAMRHLFVVVPLALLIIFGLLYMMFGEMRYAFLILLNLPFALSGGIFILLARDLYLSVSASIGFVALFGVAVLNGIVLVSHVNDLRRSGMGVREATVQGAGDRLRPVLMTALVASLGFIPMAFNVGPGSEVQRPLASVVIGGLITATLLTLFVLPTIYHWMERDDRVPAGPNRTPRGWSVAIVGFLLLSCGIPSALAAQAPGSERVVRSVSVREAIELAEAGNPGFNQVREQAEATRARRWQALGLEAPTLAYMKEGIPLSDASGFHEQRWSLAQRLQFPLTTWYGLSRASRTSSAATLDVTATLAELRASVKRAYAEVVYARQMLRLAEEELRLNQELEEAAQLRVEVGEAGGLELMKAEVERARAENTRAAARQALANARHALLAMIGLDADSASRSFEFPDSMAYVAVDLARSELRSAVSGHAGLLAAVERLAAADAGVSEGWSRLFPDIEVQYYRQDFGQGWVNHGAQLGLRVPLWGAIDGRARIREARAIERHAAWAVEGTRLDLAREAERAWAGYETGLAAVARFESDILERSAELLELTREGYRVGEIGLLTLLDTQRTFLDGQRGYWDAIRGYYRALIDLERFLDRELVFVPEESREG
ncbi:MAG: CusA/CzcA family heavy metal efflux RND transporter [Gemmatimonadota bacterium]|nr:CusA/CzcA family heavy metal efflux RND transporter [Gemmatimonadota bacterium]MDE2864130.1 CusA/CzcA family heavy metal efflux RND transporter [Gemmatimonadota bacterium]